MKFIMIAGLLLIGSPAFAQIEMLKSKAAEMKKMACPMVNGKEDCSALDVKKKGCPMINGKEDCTVTEVKTKVIEVKKKIGY